MSVPTCIARSAPSFVSGSGASDVHHLGSERSQLRNAAVLVALVLSSLCGTGHGLSLLAHQSNANDSLLTAVTCLRCHSIVDERPPTSQIIRISCFPLEPIVHSNCTSHPDFSRLFADLRLYNEMVKLSTGKHADAFLG